MQTTLDAMDQSTTYDDGLAQEELEQRVAILRRLKTYPNPILNYSTVSTML